MKVVLDLGADSPPFTVQHFDGSVCLEAPEDEYFLNAGQARLLAAILVAYADELGTQGERHE